MLHIKANLRGQAHAHCLPVHAGCSSLFIIPRFKQRLHKSSWTIHHVAQLPVQAMSWSGKSSKLCMQAANVIGESEWSEVAECATAASVPSQPEAPYITSTTATAAILGWRAPCDNGASISHYQVCMASLSLSPDRQHEHHHHPAACRLMQC